MEKEEKIKLSIKFVPIFMLFSIICVLLIIIGEQKIKIQKTDIIKYDTTYNHIVLDSIEYNIIKKDTIIYNYRKEMKNEINKASSVDDSAAIAMFYQLLYE